MVPAGLPDSAYYRAALYMRLSKDDEGTAESASITTQRKMLRSYAGEHRYTVCGEYVDDGVSGTTFDRPGFQRMLRDIEAGSINMVLTKDLSRLGRDYILAGQYTEIYFPSKRVRFIAVNDNYDSAQNPYSDIIPFKNVINEMYARDTSQKIRSAFQTRMREGAFIGAFAPYGYQRDPVDKHHLVPDSTAAAVVQKIFRQAAEGTPPRQIAAELNQKKIAPPIVYRCLNNPALNVEDYSKRKEWTSSTITKMLRNPVYLGHMAQGKTTKLSFKTGTVINNPPQNWHLVENTHLPLVSRELFDRAARRSRQRTCKKAGTFSSLFSGIARCADCGRAMSTAKAGGKNGSVVLVCGGYKLYGKEECSNHYIHYDALTGVLLAVIRDTVRFSGEEEQEVVRAVQDRLKKQSGQDPIHKRITDLQKRNRELDSLIDSLYNDRAAGFLDERRAQTLLQKYGAESLDISHELERLESSDDVKNEEIPAERVKQILDQYLNPEKLTPDLLYQLVDTIEIEQGHYQNTGNGRVKRQKIKVCFRFRGKPSAKVYHG